MEAVDPESLDELIAHLADAGVLKPHDLDRGRRVASRGGERLDRVLVKLGLIPEETLQRSWAALLGRPFIAEANGAEVIVEALDARFLTRRQMVAVAATEGPPLILQADPLDRHGLELLRLALGRDVRPAIAASTTIAALLSGLGEPVSPSRGADDAGLDIDAVDIERLKDQASDVPVIQWVNNLIASAVLAGASDVHLEPQADGLTVRWRIDGELHPAEAPPPSLAAAITSRIKILARLDIAERRLPQDGRCSVSVRGLPIDLRVATGPTPSGESVVLRVLDRHATVPELTGLGYTPRALAAIQRLMQQPHGVVLVTGPTGAGKTTTLYAMLASVRSDARKLISIEDPVEYALSGVTQIQAASGIGLGFARALRSILRHDPDIIMVGEIRDRETADVAIEAALTGHLVLSTLHTNSAVASVARLLEMGVPAYLLASALSGVVAQRLVRRLCPACAAADAEGVALATALAPNHEGGAAKRAVGCSDCRQGFRGRVAVAEVLEIDASIRRLLLAGAGPDEFDKAARIGGMTTLAADALAKVQAGITSLGEVMRVAGAQFDLRGS